MGTLMDGCVIQGEKGGSDKETYVLLRAATMQWQWCKRWPAGGEIEPHDFIYVEEEFKKTNRQKGSDVESLIFFAGRSRSLCASHAHPHLGYCVSPQSNHGQQPTVQPQFQAVSCPYPTLKQARVEELIHFSFAPVAWKAWAET